MKKLFLLLVAAISLLVVACEYDDTALKESIAKLEQRLDAVEAVQRAYENNLFIKGIQQIDNGYIITFSDNSTATIVNGDDGKDGADGADGADGKDGKDGKDGEDGKNGTNGKDGDTLIKSITIGKDSVTFVLTDGRKFTIAIYASLSVSFGVDEHTCISPNTTFKINYEVESDISDIMIDVVSSHDLYAFVSDVHAKKGQIEVAVGNAIDLHSKIIVFVSNGEKTIMRRLTFEEATLQVADESMKTLPIEGGEVTFEYLSNVDCEVVIPSGAKNWLSVVSPTRALETKSVTLKATANSEKPRSAIVSIKYAIGGLELKYTINQDGIITSLEYTTNDGKPLDPYTTEGFGTTLIENNYDAATGKGTLVFNGRPTTIPDKAFIACNNLIKFDIPSSIITIGNEAFANCVSMEEITIPSSVTSIGANAFSKCTGKAYINCKNHNFGSASFTEVVIGENVSSIGNYAFQKCSSLTSVTIPNSVTSIGNCAFENCSSLTSVTIPNSVTSIGYSAFDGCTSLTSITIPESVTSIRAIFRGCKNLSLTIYASTIRGLYRTTFEDCSIKEVYFIGTLSDWCAIKYNYVYSSDQLSPILSGGAKLYIDNKEATDITIPDNITQIHSHIFAGCSSIKSVIINDKIAAISESAFSGCTSLTNITIPDRVTSIGQSAFEKCSSLTSVTIPNSVTSIGTATFSGCASLTSITIPNSVTSIGSAAFSECTSLTSVAIPDSITSIGSYAFYGCKSLTSITIPDSVTSIANSAFAGCRRLTSVYCKPTTPPTGNSSMFSENATGRKIYVPRNSVDAYKSASYWSGYASDIVGYVF